MTNDEKTNDQMTHQDVMTLAENVLRLRAEGKDEQATAELSHLCKADHGRVTLFIAQLEANPPGAVKPKDLYC